jgi:transposase
MNRVCAAVDAVGLLLLLIHPTQAQYADCSPVETLPSAMKGIGHVIADAAHDANPLRSFLADSLSATTQVNPTGRLRR